VLYATLFALPLFWYLRTHADHDGVDPVAAARLSSYKQSEWVQVSRQKFEGLVGHDLVWCLYCDWMTGVYSLGAEILRNVESFWCPIRFYDGKKVRQLRGRFPRREQRLGSARRDDDRRLAKMEEMYGDGRREWFGHPTRLTVKGQPIEQYSNTRRRSDCGADVVTILLPAVSDAAAPYLSLVIPCYNEEENVPTLLQRVEAALNQLGRPYEVIIIDDGSTDSTPKLLEDGMRRLSWLRVIRMARNGGQSAAFEAGFERRAATSSRRSTRICRTIRRRFRDSSAARREKRST
jgi:hypothetical protein